MHPNRRSPAPSQVYASRPNAFAPNTDVTMQVDSRIESIDVKLAKLNAELSTYQHKLSRMRDGPGKSALKQKAIKILQQRKQYEAQKDQLQQQSWNMEQAGMMQDNLKNTMATVDAMKTTQKELRKQYGKINIDKIEKMQEEMADLMDMGNDIQESISRSYDVPEDVDEAELDAELEALGEELELGGGESIGEGAIPGFLTESDAVPQFIDEEPDTSKEKAAATWLQNEIPSSISIQVWHTFTNSRVLSTAFWCAKIAPLCPQYYNQI